MVVSDVGLVEAFRFNICKHRIKRWPHLCKTLTSSVGNMMPCKRYEVTGRSSGLHCLQLSGFEGSV